MKFSAFKWCVFFLLIFSLSEQNLYLQSAHALFWRNRLTNDEKLPHAVCARWDLSSLVPRSEAERFSRPLGISTHGIPFSPPIAFRHIDRRSNITISGPTKAAMKKGPTGTKSSKAGIKNEKTVLEQGLCHACSKWVNVEGVKDVEVKVRQFTLSR